MGLEWWLAGALALIGAIWTAFTRGKAKGRAAERDAALRKNARANRRMDDADIGIGASTDDNRKWLHDRGKR